MKGKVKYFLYFLIVLLILMVIYGMSFIFSDDFKLKKYKDNIIYLNAIENKVVTDKLNKKYELCDGVFSVDTINKVLNYNGVVPTRGYVQIKDAKVIKAEFEYNKKHFKYEDSDWKEVKKIDNYTESYDCKILINLKEYKVGDLVEFDAGDNVKRKWYVIDNNELNVDLILSENYVNDIKWCTLVDDINVDECKEFNALKSLPTLREWNKVNSIEILSFERISSIAGFDDKPNIEKYDFPQFPEKFEWLYKTTAQTNDYAGYWLSTPANQTPSIHWYMSSYGYINYTLSEISGYGIRPVINVDKKVLEGD